MTRSRWRVTGWGRDGRPVEVHHHGMEVHRRGADGSWYFFSTTRSAPMPPGRSTARSTPTDTNGLCDRLSSPSSSWRGAQRRGHPESGPTGWPRPFGARHDGRCFRLLVRLGPEPGAPAGHPRYLLHFVPGAVQRYQAMDCSDVIPSPGQIQRRDLIFTGTRRTMTSAIRDWWSWR
jgi:hypothetical protein